MKKQNKKPAAAATNIMAADIIHYAGREIKRKNQI